MDTVFAFTIRASGASPHHDCDEHAIADEVTPLHQLGRVGKMIFFGSLLLAGKSRKA
jgi:hypothetical protein